ncbi:MAG: RHS repeat protein [Fimbriimonadia bacterium]|nr:RHS repeat protein [Fimbriimonadia bacterium]
MFQATADSRGVSPPEHPGPARGSQEAEGKTYLKLVWRSENTKPPDNVSARALASAFARAVASYSPSSEPASARAKASMGSLSVTANITSNPSTSETIEAEMDMLSQELTVQQDTNGQYYVIIAYPVTLETEVDTSSEASLDYCVYPPEEEQRPNNGEATASFERLADIFSAGDTVLLISGTALVDGAGAICDVDLCGLQPATGQIAFGIPFPALDTAHTGYSFHSAPSHSSTPFYGLETIRIVYDSAAEVSDIRLQSYWRDTPVVPTWETHPFNFDWSPIPLDKQPTRERWVTVYDANGVALRFKATEQLPAGNWIYEGAQGVLSTLTESASLNEFVLTGGPPGAMHAIGAWTYLFEPITGYQSGGQTLFSGRSGSITQVIDPLGNAVTLSRNSAGVWVYDTVSKAHFRAEQTGGVVHFDYDPPGSSTAWIPIGSHNFSSGTEAFGSFNWNNEVVVSWQSQGLYQTYALGSPNSALYSETRKFEPIVTNESNKEVDPFAKNYDFNRLAQRMTQFKVGNLNPINYHYDWQNEIGLPSNNQFRVQIAPQGKRTKELRYFVSYEEGKEGTFEKMEFKRPSLLNASIDEKTVYTFNDAGQIKRVEFYSNATSTLARWREEIGYVDGNPLLVSSVSHTDLGSFQTVTATATYLPIEIPGRGFEWVMTSTTDPSGVRLDFAYGENGNPPHLLTSITNALHRQWHWNYSSIGQLTSFSEPNRPEWVLEYYADSDANYPNKLKQIIDPEQRTVKISQYDLLGRPKRIETYPSLTSTLWQETTRNVMGMPTEIRWSDDTQVSMFYDGPVLSSVTDALGRTATLTYNAGTASLNTISISGQLFAALEYDPFFGRLTRIEGGNAVGINYGYTSALDIVGERDVLRSVVYDVDSLPESFTYACCGQLESWTRQDGRSTFYQFSTRGLLESIRLNSLQSPPAYVMSYDPAGRLLQLFDPTTPTDSPHTWTYQSNTGHLISDSTSLPIGEYTWSYSYLPSGEISQATLTYPNSQLTTTWSYYYDNSGLLTEVKRNGSTVATHNYDGAGRLVSQTVPPLGLDSTIQYADNQSVGAVGLLSHSINSQTIALFDYRGNHTSSNREDWGYYADGTLRRAKDQFNNTQREWEWSYSAQGALESETLSVDQSNSPYQWNFNYDSGGNLTLWQEEVGGQQNWQHQYNSIFNRLSWINGLGWYYAYSPNGERSRWWTSAQQSLEGDVNRDGQVDDVDLLLVLLAYGSTCSGCPEDLNQDGIVDDTDVLIVLFNYGLQIGTLSWEYSYDVWGNLTQASSAAVGTYQAVYDGFGRRAWQEINGVRTYFVYDGDTIVAELDANGNLLVEYTWGLLGPLARHDLQNPSNNRYYVIDGLGHTRLLLDRLRAGANPASRNRTLT